MKSKELAEILLENPDFDVRFAAFSYKQEMFIHYDVDTFDIGYSEKVITLSGEET
jgi:hypothetical protein